MKITSDRRNRSLIEVSPHERYTFAYEGFDSRSTLSYLSLWFRTVRSDFRCEDSTQLRLSPGVLECVADRLRLRADAVEADPESVPTGINPIIMRIIADEIDTHLYGDPDLLDPTLGRAIPDTADWLIERIDTDEPDY